MLLLYEDIFKELALVYLGSIVIALCFDINFIIGFKFIINQSDATENKEIDHQRILVPIMLTVAAFSLFLLMFEYYDLSVCLIFYR